MQYIVVLTVLCNSTFFAFPSSNFEAFSIIRSQNEASSFIFKSVLIFPFSLTHLIIQLILTYFLIAQNWHELIWLSPFGQQLRAFLEQFRIKNSTWDAMLKIFYIFITQTFACYITCFFKRI